MNVFERIYQSNSMTAIGIHASRELETAADPATRAQLGRILEADSLDEVHALAAEALGRLDEARDIREQRAARQARRRLLEDRDAELLEL